jgi:hypothetical protein
MSGLHTPGKESRFPFNRSRGGPQCQSGRGDEDKMFYLLGIELSLSGRPALSLIIMLIEST